MGFSLAYGGYPSASSIAVMPNDHMSALQSYRFPMMISGAIQKGVPMRVLRLANVFSSCTETPKSANLAIPF